MPREEKDCKVSETSEINVNNKNFIMLPKVDFCFKELMHNAKVRRGFIAAVLGKDPSEIRKTTLIPTELRRGSPDDKLGILDVMVELEDGTKLNMEMQVPHFGILRSIKSLYPCQHPRFYPLSPG